MKIDNKISVFKNEINRIRKNRLDLLMKDETFLAGLLVFACFLSDLYLIKVRWNLVQMQNALFVWCSASTCAAALNIPLSVAGKAFKKNEQEMCSRRERNVTMILAVIIFLIAYACNFAFTWTTRDLVFSLGTISNLIDNAATATAEQKESAGVLVAAFYSAIMPLLTSLSAFVVSYATYNPLNIMLKGLKKEKIEIDANLLEIDVALKQADSAEKFCEGLMAAANDEYEMELRGRDEENQLFKQEVNIYLAKQMKTPQENGEIAKSSHLLLKNYKQQKLPLKQQLPEYILNQLIFNDQEQIVGIKNINNAA